MKEALLMQLISFSLSLVSEESVKQMADKVIDVVETAVEESDNSIDDKYILPLCSKVRDAFGIEDND